MQMQSGDLLLCQGNGKFSKVIEWQQKHFTHATDEEAKTTHVARIVEYLVGGLAVLESTTLNNINGVIKKGVQINPLLDWLRAYNGHVCLRKLDFERTQEYRINDASFWTKFKNKPYENGIAGGMEMLLCSLQFNTVIKKLFPRWQPKPTDEPHCGELIGYNLDWHEQFTDKFHIEQSINRLPPWFWVNRIDKYLTCPIGKPIQLK